MQHSDKGLEQDLKQAVEYFEKSIKLDSTFALGYTGLAYTYSILGHFHIIPPEKAWQKLEDSAKKDFALDSNLSEAHISLALFKIFCEYDWKGAESELDRAIELDPENAYGYSRYSLYFAWMDQPDNALIQIEKALKLNPHSCIIKTGYFWSLISTGQINEAMKLATKEISSNKDQVNPLMISLPKTSNIV